MAMTMQAPAESPPGEEERMDADVGFGLTDGETMRQYGGKVAAMWNREVWGAGDTYGEALRNAEERIGGHPAPGKPPVGALVYVPIPLPAPAAWIRAEY